MNKRLLLFFVCCGVALLSQAQTRWTELKDWSFRKEAQTEWERVSLPHSCNALDGQSARYYRGLTHYRTEVAKGGVEQFLYVMGAAQWSVVYVNGQKVEQHGGGYTPFCVRLTPFMKPGQNVVQIDCDNTLNRQLAPVSSDFNKNNGLHNKVYLVETGDAFCGLNAMGYDGLHVTPLNVTPYSADIKINTIVYSSSDKPKPYSVVFKVRNKRGKVIAANREKITLDVNAGKALSWTYMMSNPHLWNGLADPYLYTAEVELWSGSKKIETNKAHFGVRFYELDSIRGFLLNGKPYPLRGMSMHQDWKGAASAVKDEMIKRDFEIVKELGCNMIRLAHYPHNRHVIDQCDRLGLVVQTEIPWVNECGTDTALYDQKAYTDNLHQQMKEMIVSHYNHPSIIFWGMWNELGNIDGSRPQGAQTDKEAVVRTTASLYSLARQLDSTRSVGFADCALGLTTPQLRHGVHFDYYGFNIYNGWYQNSYSPEGAKNFAKTLARLQKRAPYVAVTEYGAGANPFCHSLNPVSTTGPSVGGARHDEEWANRVHEIHLQTLSQSPWLQFSTGWILFDFAVGARHEGYKLSSNGIDTKIDSAYMFLNDKGIVSRDRTTKKDAFYLYKSAWNKTQPTVYITSRRFVERPSDSVAIKAYSNLSGLTLYQNGREVQRLQSSGEPSGVIWTFNPVRFQTAEDKFRVVGRDSKGKEWADEVTFKKIATTEK